MVAAGRRAGKGGSGLASGPAVQASSSDARFEVGRRVGAVGEGVALRVATASEGDSRLPFWNRNRVAVHVDQRNRSFQEQWAVIANAYCYLRHRSDSLLRLT